MSITAIKKRKAVFYDDKGEEIGSCGFPKDVDSFKYGNKTFVAVHDNMSCTTVKRWYWNTEIYHYNINNPFPYRLNKKCEPLLSTEMLNTLQETKVARDLNDLAKPKMAINLKLILIVLAVGIFAYLVGSGQIPIFTHPVATAGGVKP